MAIEHASKPNTFKSLDKEFDVMDFSSEPPAIPATYEKPDNALTVFNQLIEQEAIADIQEVVAMTKEASEKLLSVADVSEHPRHFEVLAAMLRMRLDANKELLAASRTKKEDVPGTGGVINNTQINIADAASINDIMKAIKR